MQITTCPKCGKQGNLKACESEYSCWNCMISYVSREPSKEHLFLRHLVDVVWGVAHEDESVPSTDWADRMIAKAKETFGTS